MTKAEIEKIVADSIAKALGNDNNATSADGANTTPTAPTKVTVESVQKMVNDAVAKALTPQEEQVTAENINEIVEKAVSKAIEPILKSRALPSALGNDNDGEVKNSEPHYLAGLL